MSVIEKSLYSAEEKRCTAILRHSDFEKINGPSKNKDADKRDENDQNKSLEKTGRTF